MSIHQVLQFQSDRNPDAVAIQDASGFLTYQQLHSRVNRLANYLRQQGIKPEVLVGIYTERSIDTAIAILAVLQAGGAYVPLDPTYPQDRLESILEDTNLKLILTQAYLATNLANIGVNLFLLDVQAGELATQSELAPAQTTGESLAYIMYTSGSTGKPQGVQITIEQIDCYLKAVNEVMQIQPDDVYLLSASFSFSSSIRQLLLPLSQGAKVVITSKDNTTNLFSLVELIQREKITVFDTVASVWNYMLISLAEMEPEQSRQLMDSQIRLLIFSGGLLTSQLLDRVRSQFQEPPQVVNIYGQTETIGVCAYPIPNDFNRTEGYAPVGRAYLHNPLYILNDELEHVAAGVTGELCVSVPSLVRGYLNNSQLNDRKFISNPFTDEPQSRLYKTGDLARYLPDGNLEIVGRQDFQVKVRGMRVEIEEIETVLMQHPDVQQAAVVGKNRSTSGANKSADEQIIVAYIVPARSEININDLRSFLKTKLTDYAIPSAFEILPALPLTPNNKLDRKRLPEPTYDRSTVTSPRDALELQLTQIWEKALGIQPIGITDNFFDLGGHSLIALQVFAQIEQVWHKRLSWGVLFKSPTITKIADLIRQDEILTTWSPLVLLKSGKHKPPLFFIHALGGTLFGYYDLVRRLGEDRPIYGLQSQGIDGKQHPLERVEDMASYFIQSIQTVQPQGPYCLLGYSFGGLVAFEIARQLAELGERVEFLGLVDIRSPIVSKDTMSVKKWLRFHIGELQQLQFKDRVKYFTNKLTHRVALKTKGYAEEYKNMMANKLSAFEMFKPELLNVLESNLQATKNYTPQVYQGRATLFWCEYQSLYIEKYPDLGWGNLVSGGVDTVFIPGEHLSLLAEPHVRVFADKLKSVLDNDVVVSSRV
ncbi:amino acid adenylation domain-containing protein [Chamaesiphon sp. GL140_3_metabinner_50]|uniref:non-ribosomal peptide synthetase n=1 Tax=Chamaesiphon sp. GL140_3_metabinner_50 TaxID=2970812 RepID=UPI0025CCEF7A|nr:amino acid adenylation domain-containing protein [Chamaesiphon sp. GL140_3_metabinner_50]